MGIKLSLLCFILLMLNSCQPKKDYESIAKYIYSFNFCDTFDINQVDNFKQLIEYRTKNNSNSFLGVFFNLDKLEISDDSGNYKCTLPLFDFKVTDHLSCKESPRLKLNLNNTNFTVTENYLFQKDIYTFEYSNLKEFDSFIVKYCIKVFGEKQINNNRFETYWNNIIINDSISFKTKLFPVLNSMYRNYIKTCISYPNFNFSLDRNKKIKDYFSEVTIYDYDIPPIKEKIKFTPPSIVEIKKICLHSKQT